MVDHIVSVGYSLFEGNGAIGIDDSPLAIAFPQQDPGEARLEASELLRLERVEVSRVQIVACVQAISHMQFHVDMPP